MDKSYLVERQVVRAQDQEDLTNQCKIFELIAAQDINAGEGERFSEERVLDALTKAEAKKLENLIN